MVELNCGDEWNNKCAQILGETARARLENGPTPFEKAIAEETARQRINDAIDALYADLGAAIDHFRTTAEENRYGK
jgi:hypothetical protein